MSFNAAGFQRRELIVFPNKFECVHQYITNTVLICTVHSKPIHYCKMIWAQWVQRVDPANAKSQRALQCFMSCGAYLSRLRLCCRAVCTRDSRACRWRGGCRGSRRSCKRVCKWGYSTTSRSVRKENLQYVKIISVSNLKA